jgi:diadenosine tetraphosphate (Ap4A) HIT family hydrolase
MVHLPYMFSKYGVTSKTCRFCMLPEPERIALETPNFVVLMGLGPIAIGYCIIITKKHYASYAELPDWYLPEFLEVVKTVQNTQRKVFGASLLFEHGRNGGCLLGSHNDELCHHAHMHLLPTIVNLASAVRADYPLEFLPGLDHLSRTARRGTYLLVQDGDDLNCTLNPQALPPRYLRTKAAEQVLNDAALADWQAFPSYDMIFEGKQAMQTELLLAWQESRREASVQRPLPFRFPQWRKPAGSITKSR